MSPRSNYSNASSSKQKKKNDSLPSAPLSSPPTSAVASPAVTPAPAPASASPKPLPQPAAASTTLLQDASPAASPSATSNPRVFVASTLKPASAIDTVTSTISALSHQANRGISSLIAAHSNPTVPPSPLVTASADHSTPLRTDGSVSPIYDAFHNAGSPPDPARIAAALKHAHQSEHAPRASLPRLVWSRWDRLPLKAHPCRSAPLLISYFDDGTLQVLQVYDRQISELLCLPNAADVLHDRAASSLPRPHLLTALVRHPSADSTDPQLLIVLQEPDNATRLLAYSLAAHQVQAAVQLQHQATRAADPVDHVHDRSNALWPQVETQCNERFLVLSFASPASIHVLSTSSLEYLHSPILDVAAASSERPSPISLSHRLLAYACTASHDLSPIRSDGRKVSNAAYHDPTRPFASTPPDASGRVGEMRDNLFETSAHVGDAARRIRGGVLSGVRTLGEWGSSYWPQAGSPPATTAAFSPPQPCLLSQSAPHTAHPSRPPSSASISPMLLAADGGRSAKRLSTGATPAAAAPSIKAEVAVTSTSSSHALQAGCVRVVDLGSDARSVCAFTPSSHAVVRLCFGPCGRLLLTADSLGHAFHVFELSLSGSFGHMAPTSSAAVLHRYKLMRGITTADVVHAEWSPDAQWIAVGTRSGTVHTYAVNPFGGVPSIANHVHGKVRNPQVLQPFGVSLASLARSTRPSPPPQQDAPAKSASAPSAESGQPATTTKQVRAAPPSFLLIGSGAGNSGSDGNVHVPFELLTNDSRGASVTLHALRCWSTQTRASTAGASNEDGQVSSLESKQRLATATSPRSSGLSQMMRKAGEGLLYSQQAPRLQAECARIALWEHLAPESGAVAKQSVPTLLDQTSSTRSMDRSEVALLKPLASVAQAEIETYSQSPAMLPSSIFLSRQMFFHARARSSKPASAQAGTTESMRCVHRRGSRPIQVRRTARMVSREASSDDSTSFDDSLAGALGPMSLDPESLPPRSASAHIPSFPQGQRGRSAGWTTGSSIPIRIVAGGLGGIYRAGKELGRGVEMARRRTSGASATAAPEGSGGFAASTNAASVSFDGVDDVDLLGDDEDAGQAGRHLYHMGKARSRHVDQGSMRSDSSLLSALRSDMPLRGSQASSAETPSTRFSEPEDPAIDGLEADADDCGWDAIEASSSPAAPEAPLFVVAEDGSGRHQPRDEAEELVAEPTINSLDDDFTVGMLDEDSGEATMTHSRTSLSPAQGMHSRLNTPKELVYALPTGGSTRSSLLSQSSGLTATAEARVEAKGSQPSPRDSSPSGSDGDSSGSQTSGGSGLLCEGSKETHTSDNSPVSVAADLDDLSKNTTDKVVEAASIPKPISTSGGGKKKKKKGGR